MIFSNDRDKLRQTFYTVWQKAKNQQILEPLESIIAEVIQMHPEYQPLLEQSNTLKKDFLPEMGETNPFLHMSMHIAIKEQMQAKKPAGIEPLYQKSLKKTRDAHKTEHIILECLGEALWKAQRNNQMPDEKAYLRCIKKSI